MESISAHDAKTRLSELLTRAASGESFLITRYGRPVARLVPEGGVNRARATAAVERLRSFRGAFGDLRLEDLLAAGHEGHRFCA